MSTSEQSAWNQSMPAALSVAHLDPQCSFLDQLQEVDEGPVTVINAMVAPQDGMDQLLTSWQSEAQVMKGCPGFISAQLYRGVGTSNIATIVAVWESAAALRTAFTRLAQRHDQLIAPPPGTIAHPTLVRPHAVNGICIA